MTSRYRLLLSLSLLLLVAVTLFSPSTKTATLIRANQIQLADIFAFTGVNTHSQAEVFNAGLVTGNVVPVSVGVSTIGTAALPFGALNVGAAANTLTSQTSAATGNRSVVWPDAAGTPILDTATQTLTNKTFTSPVLTSPTTTGTDTGTETLTNKTLTGPVMSAPSITTAPVATGSAATLTGTGACATITTQTGGSWAGSAKCTGATAASTLTITPGSTAPNGWICYVQDQTTRGNLFQQTSNTTGACVLTITSVTQNDVFVFSAVAF